MGSKSWKQKEALVALWFSTKRNPLSGRNNRDDNGNKRLGDIIHPSAAVEIKHRKSLTMEEAIKVAKLVKQRPNTAWLLVEFKVARSGSAPEADMVKLTMNLKTAEAVCACLDRRWRAGII